MELTVGSIFDGKVTGIMKFGAFVSLPEGRSGLVHISEIAHTYVSDVNEYLKVGQEVKVKIISIDDSGRINLSIKKTQEPPARQPSRGGFSGGRGNAPQRQAPPPPATFEDKLKQFMQDSDSRLSGVRQFEKSTRRRGGGSRGGYND